VGGEAGEAIGRRGSKGKVEYRKKSEVKVKNRRQKAENWEQKVEA
jgi:hypothetical protein